MADKLISLNEQIKHISDDTFVFLDDLKKQNGMIEHLIESMDSKANVDLTRVDIKKTLDEDWMDAVEQVLPVIDTVIRNYSVGIVQNEEVKNIEFIKKVTQRAIVHLGQHTDFIADFDKDGNVRPSKLLNVSNDETMLTYENKFVNTLILRLFIFVDRRYSKLKERGLKETDVTMDFESEFKVGMSGGKMKLSISTENAAEASDQNENFNRISHIHSICMSFMSSSFCKGMGGVYIKPPVMRTNAISKNKYLRQILDLWDYIENYEKVGYTIEKEERREKPNQTFLSNLYALMGLNYLVFTHSLDVNVFAPESILEILNLDQYDPSLDSTEHEEFENEFKLGETDYKRVVPNDLAAFRLKKKYSEDERAIRDALQNAIKNQKEIDKERLMYRDGLINDIEAEKLRLVREERERKRIERLEKEKAKRAELEKKRLEEERLERERQEALQREKEEKRRQKALELAQKKAEQERKAQELREQKEREKQKLLEKKRKEQEKLKAEKEAQKAKEKAKLDAQKAKEKAEKDALKLKEKEKAQKAKEQEALKLKEQKAKEAQKAKEQKAKEALQLAQEKLEAKEKEKTKAQMKAERQAKARAEQKLRQEQIKQELKEKEAQRRAEYEKAQLELKKAQEEEARLKALEEQKELERIRKEEALKKEAELKRAEEERLRKEQEALILAAKKKEEEEKAKVKVIPQQKSKPIKEEINSNADLTLGKKPKAPQKRKYNKSKYLKNGKDIRKQTKANEN